jgi:hypothetical protein
MATKTNSVNKNIVVNLQSVCVSLPADDVKDAIETGEFDLIRDLVLAEIKRAFERGDGIESIEEI